MPQSPKKPRFRWIGLIGLAACLGFGAGSIASVGLSLMPLHKGDRPSMRPQTKIPMQLTRPVNLLVMGIDATGNDAHGLNGNSDTMLWLQFQPDAGRVQALSLPRDTLVPIPGYGRTKLNAANAYGGPTLAARTAGQLLGGVKFDRYLRIDTQGLIRLVDALGGVEVTIPKRMYYRDRTQGLLIDFQPGKQRLSGQKLQEYLRFRNDELGDIGRVQRQQGVLQSLKGEFLNPTTLLKMPQLLQVAHQTIDTNLSMAEILSLIGFMRSGEGFKLKTEMLPGRFSRPGEFRSSYWVPDQAAIDIIRQQKFQ
jgi:polyisoprenyl-teichoic acid--peptidoglycan teichoic acid transferase